MTVYGLTGGIATGKSTVSRILADYGDVIIDADCISRELVKKGQPALDDIVQIFGKEYLHHDGTLNRQKLGQHIFHDEKEKEKLDHIMQPRLRQEISRQIHSMTSMQTVIVDMPLLFEFDMTDLVDKIIVVATDESIQCQRLMKRNQLSYRDAMARIHSQWPQDKKIKGADIVLYNNGTENELIEKIQQFIKNR